MLIPRFSIRWLLGLTTFSACISLVLSFAVRGHAWAIGVVAGLWVLVVTFLFFSLAFLLAWLITGGQRNSSRQTPPAPIDQPLHPAPTTDLPPPITG